jgi:multidrug resistance protein
MMVTSETSSLSDIEKDGEKDNTLSGSLPPSDTAIPDDVEAQHYDPSIPQTKSELPPDEVNKAAFKVDWEPDDPANPKNWSVRYKSWITFQLGMLALAASAGSSIIAPAEDAISEHFHISTELTVLVVSLYVLGFALGPLCWAPLSEIAGRKLSLLPAMVCLALFSIGTATSQSAASVFVTRFFSGVFGSAPVSNVSAALGDMYEPKARGIAVSLYAVAVVGGPTVAPVIGAALTQSLSWRWTQYIQAIWVFAVVVLAFFGMPELYGPVLLKRKAKKLRAETGDQRYWHPSENTKLDFKSIITKQLSRPLRMLFTEPMVACIALYASFVYALLYLTLEVFPIVFVQERHWGLVVSSLPFLGLFVGVLFALAINIGNQPRYARILDANKGRPVPEARLAPMVVGGFLFVIGLFWFGWTAAPQIPWIVPVIATAFIGAGFNIIFQQCINFLVDTYGLYAASAVSANTFLRSILASGLPMAAKPMFRALGVGPAMSLLGAVSCLALPVPFIFMKYGLRLRKMSSFAPVVED